MNSYQCKKKMKKKRSSGGFTIGFSGELKVLEVVIVSVDELHP